jgi:N-acetylglutamate synthase-like GNAT family acetyltransferase
MTMQQAHPKLDRLVIRTYRTEDQAAVSRLYTDGLLLGQIDPNDTAADLENIHDAYFCDSANHFWVADVDGHVVGMIGVARDLEHTAEIRRLRVDKNWQTAAVGSRLIQTALSHCKHHGYLKVVFDTRFERTAALEMFDRFGFQHTRSKSLHGKELLEFYLDLYRQPRKNG